MAVYLEVRHRIKPITNTAFDLFVDFYADTVVPAMERHGIDLIGAWKMTGGEMGWDISIHRYESMAHAEECLGSLGQDKALWSAVEKLRGEIEIEEVTKFANRVSYGTEERLQAALETSDPAQPRQYMLAVLQTAGGGLLPRDRRDRRAGRHDGQRRRAAAGHGLRLAHRANRRADRPLDHAAWGGRDDGLSSWRPAQGHHRSPARTCAGRGLVLSQSPAVLKDAVAAIKSEAALTGALLPLAGGAAAKPPRGSPSWRAPSVAARHLPHEWGRTAERCAETQLRHHPTHDLVGQLDSHVEVFDGHVLVVSVEAGGFFGAEQDGDEAVGGDSLLAQEAIVGPADAG